MLKTNIILPSSTYDEAIKSFKELVLFSNIESDLIIKLDDDYFQSPASTRYHNSFRHGLLYHSINSAILIYKNLVKLREVKVNEEINILSDIDFEEYLKEAIIVGLFHDYCKVGCYKKEENYSNSQKNRLIRECDINELDIKNFLNSGLGMKSMSLVIDYLIKGNIEEALKVKPQYIYEDNFNIGHSEKSIIQLLRIGFKLSNNQIYTIRYHMYELDALYQVNKELFLYYIAKIPMLKCLILAEKMSGFIYESN